MTQNEPKLPRAMKLLINLMVTLLVTVLAMGVLVVLLYERPDWFEPKPVMKEAMVETEKSTADPTEFIAGEHRLLVVANCTGCHSGKLVTQNRATREGWRNMIRWMQETQNLKDLGPDEEKILDYLSTHYAPAKQGRRQNLQVEEWYSLD